MHTLRRVDRLQPALLLICLASTIGFAVTYAGERARLRWSAAAGFLLILVGSVVVADPDPADGHVRLALPADDVDGLRARWLRGHLIRTLAAVVLFILAVASCLRVSCRMMSGQHTVLAASKGTKGGSSGRTHFARGRS